MKTIVILDIYKDLHWKKELQYKQKFAEEHGITYDKDSGFLYYVLDVPYLPKEGDYVGTRFGRYKADYVVYELEPKYEGFKSNPVYYFDCMSQIHLIEI